MTDMNERGGTSETAQSGGADAGSAPIESPSGAAHVESAGDSRPARTDSSDADPAAPEPMSTPVLSGRIEREHAAFVVLGALATVAVFLQLAGIAF